MNDTEMQNEWNREMRKRQRAALGITLGDTLVRLCAAYTLYSLGLWIWENWN